jgi:hypothetical protein
MNRVVQEHYPMLEHYTALRNQLMDILIYREALLIFYGKASIYLKALGKTLPEQWQAWIA